VSVCGVAEPVSIVTTAGAYHVRIVLYIEWVDIETTIALDGQVFWSTDLMSMYHAFLHALYKGPNIFLVVENMEFVGRFQSRGGRFLDFLDIQPVATGSRCKMLF
jgi:hypothetical protein